MGGTWENILCKGPEAGTSFKYPQNQKKGSEALEVVGGRAGVGIQVPSQLSSPSQQVDRKCISCCPYPAPKYVVPVPEVM